ncbi:MAG: lamin tail domain-containing protein [Ferruginibacter sp.]
MITKSFFPFTLFLLVIFTGRAQITENFSDGNYLTNPGWIPGGADWIINPVYQLQSNNTTANSTYYLSTPSTVATNAEWEIYVGLGFNTSSANYADIFLTASSSDLTASSTSGYFVRIGNTDDEISLYRKTTAGITKIIDGVNGITASVNNTLKIKVTRDAANQWTLFRDITGTGNAFLSEGSVTDATIGNSAFFGLLVKQSTASFFQRHFFDDIIVKPYSADITAPVIEKATAISPNTVDVLFSEHIEITSGSVAANYSAGSMLGVPRASVVDPDNKALVHLTFQRSFTSGLNYLLTVNNVKDLYGNRMVNGNAAFTYFEPYAPRLYDVVISEVMADPTPLVKLPGNEWIELTNTTAAAIDLQGWRIGGSTGQSGPMQAYILLPDSAVIVCAATNVSSMAAFGPAIAVTAFPSLDNTADLLLLKTPQNGIIHSVSYKDDWYGNELKKEGGWTLEMIDTRNPCSGSTNWKASADLRGGSPAKKNSVAALNPDVSAPRLLRAYPADSLNIILVFDEAVDSLKAGNPGNFTISDGIGVPSSVVVLSPLFDRVSLQLSKPLLRNTIYTLTAIGLTDCGGNMIGKSNMVKTGLSEVADASDIVINEILFNPPSNGTDYIEIYNRSKKIIDLSQTYVASRSSSGGIIGIAQLSMESTLLFPDDFLVVSENTAIVKSGYIVQNMDALIEINTMPSFNDDKGTVLILNAQGYVTDELHYDEKWHFKLIDNREGVALERIDYDAPTQSQENWHSAATSTGYGTPTYKNSQYRVNDGVQGEVKISPEIVSPDNDGQDDFAQVDYHFSEPGYVANITIFDASGRPVRYLQRNALCGTKGSYRWDGLGEKNQRLSTGLYVIFTEIFNLKGSARRFKNAIVLARRK